MTCDKIYEIADLTDKMAKWRSVFIKQDRERNYAAINAYLQVIMIKRTAISRTIDGNARLVPLAPHQTMLVGCPLSEEQRTALVEADHKIQKEAREQYLTEKAAAASNGLTPTRPVEMYYLGRAQIPRVGTVFPAMLKFSQRMGKYCTPSIRQ